MRHGQADAETHRILERLGQLGLPRSIPVLELYTRHRRPGVRQRAFLALSGIEHPTASERVARGLRDPDPRLRAAVARALSRMQAHDVLSDLFLAFERGVEAAADAIGALGDDASVERFSEQLGKRSLQAMLSGYEAYLQRDDIDVETKLSIVAALGEVPGVEVKRFLLGQLRALPAATSPRLLRAIRATARRMAAKPDDRPEGERSE